MSQPNLKYDAEHERAFEIAQARADLLRLAEEQGVGPVTNFDDLLGHPPQDDEGNDDVDNFLRLLREWHTVEIPKLINHQLFTTNH